MGWNARSVAKRRRSQIWAKPPVCDKVLAYTYPTRNRCAVADLMDERRAAKGITHQQALGIAKWQQLARLKGKWGKTWKRTQLQKNTLMDFCLVQSTFNITSEDTCSHSVRRIIGARIYSCWTSFKPRNSLDFTASRNTSEALARRNSTLLCSNHTPQPAVQEQLVYED